MGIRGGSVPRRAAASDSRGAMPRTYVAAARWLAAHEPAAAALLFAAFVLVYLWPVLIGGDLLSPRATFYQFAPWALGAPAGWQRMANFILGDVPMSYYPLNAIARAAIHSGTFPAWSQHAYAGVPYFTDPQIGLFTPFNVPLWIMSLDDGIGVSAALKVWAAASGMYLLVRELKLGFWPAVLAGVSFALSAFGVDWLTHEAISAVAVLLPWNIWLVERIIRTGRLGPAIGLALTTAIAIAGGHPGTEIHMMLATGLYALVRAGNAEQLVRSERLRRGVLVAGGALVGILLMAFVLVPVIRAGAGTIGVQARIGENDTIPGQNLPLGTIRTALFPDWWGRASDLSTNGPQNYVERTFYAGGVATLLAAMALVSRGNWRRKAPFALLAGIGLAVPLHAPVLLWLATHLPVLRQVQFQRMILLYCFGVTVLAAFGLQRLLDAPRERRRAAGVLAAGGAIGLAALAAASVSVADLRQAATNTVHLRHAVGGMLPGSDPNVGGMVATSVGWWLFVVVGVALLLGALWRWPHRRRLVAVALAAFAALDVLAYAHDFQPMQPLAKIALPRTPGIAYVERHAADGRVVGLFFALQNDWDAIYGLRDVRGYDPPQPSLRWYHLWKSQVYPEQLDWSQTLLLALPGRSGLNALSVLGTRYVFAGPGTRAPAQLPELAVGYSGPDATVLVNADAVPRAMVAPRVALTGSERGTIAAIADPRFEPRDEVVVERGEPGAVALARTSGTGGAVRVVRETNATVTLHAALRRPGLVVLNDSLAPGWSVRVDGKPAAVVRVNDVMRGVAAGAGTHTIVWSYRIPGLGLGIALSAVGLLALLAACLALARTRRRAKRMVASAPAARRSQTDRS